MGQYHKYPGSWEMRKNNKLQVREAHRLDYCGDVSGQAEVWRVGRRGMIRTNSEGHRVVLQCRMTVRVSEKCWSGVLEWKWSIKLGIIAVTEDIEYSKHFTGDEERKDHDERNAEELRCHLHYLVRLEFQTTSLTDICRPSQFTPCCCHHGVCTSCLSLLAVILCSAPVNGRKKSRWRGFVVSSRRRQGQKKQLNTNWNLFAFWFQWIRDLDWLSIEPVPWMISVCVEEIGLNISVKGFTVYTFSLAPPVVDWDTWPEEVDTMEVRVASHPGPDTESQDSTSQTDTEESRLKQSDSPYSRFTPGFSADPGRGRANKFNRNKHP